MQIRLEMTCGACPEQYDAFDETGKQVGYLRLRHGSFTVECPDVGGTEVYSANPDGNGIFTAAEREFYLTAAKSAIENYYFESRPNKYVVAYISLFENNLKQVIVEAESELDAAYQYLAEKEDIFYDAEDRTDSLEALIDQMYNMDSNLSVIKI
jgi:hypothetical protein